MAINNTHISIININFNDLNTPIKRQRLEEWIKKQNLSFCYLQKKTFNLKIKICILKAKRWGKEVFQANGTRC